MSKILKKDKNTEECFKDLLRFLLEQGKVKGIFTLANMDNNEVDYSLITDPDMVKSALPFFPLMPANGGKLLSRFTLKEKAEEPIAVVLKPCELRAFIELVKREQGSLENIFLISYTCNGVYPLEFSINGEINEMLSEYWNMAKKGDIISTIRPTCKCCEYFLPYNADITISLIGKDVDTQCEIFLNTEKAKEIVSGWEGESGEGEIETEVVKKLLDKRKQEKKKLFDEMKPENFGISGLIETFGRCISCYGCNRVCPICYCILCDFISRDHEYEPSTYEAELEKRGGVRVPPNTVFYHIGRLTHIGVSCVGCGMCSDVCPADIPISTIFLKVGDEVQKMFNYIPGKNVEEEIPLVKYEKEEFVEVED